MTVERPGSGSGYDQDVVHRITVSLGDEVLRALNEHTQASPLSRSELVEVAVRRFLRDERRRAQPPHPAAQVARRVAEGELPSRPLDGRRLALRGAPWDN